MMIYYFDTETEEIRAFESVSEAKPFLTPAMVRVDSKPDGTPYAAYKKDANGNYVPDEAAELERAKGFKVSELKAAYQSAIDSDIVYMNTTFQADAKSQDLIVKTLSASGGTLPDGFFWVDANNNQVPMTYADLQGLANAILQRGQQAFAKYQTLKAQVNAATTVDEVNAINIAI